jgi:Protein of unknown function (DUF1403)
MNSKSPLPQIESNTQRFLPRWVTSLRDANNDTLTFSSGAAIAVLDGVLRDPNGPLPASLLRDRLALDAAAACLRFESRRETSFDIRDAVCLARAGDALGPAGDMFIAWRKLARINMQSSGWQTQMKNVLPVQIAEMVHQPTSTLDSPVMQATQVLAETLQQFPRQESAALMLADVTLTKAMGWNRPVPIFAAKLSRRDLSAIVDGDTDLSCRIHRAIIGACDSTIRTAADLCRRATGLQQSAPKLRAKGAANALALFLSHDAVSPSGMLSPTIRGTSIRMTDRSARRLCDRLVELGVIRELTGRSTFRLYGL